MDVHNIAQLLVATTILVLAVYSRHWMLRAHRAEGRLRGLKQEQPALK